MARTKQLNVKVIYTGTPYIINDLGESKSPRFELYNVKTHSVESKSINPLDFDKIVFGDDKIDVEFSETKEPAKPKRGRRRKI